MWVSAQQGCGRKGWSGSNRISDIFHAFIFYEDLILPDMK